MTTNSLAILLLLSAAFASAKPPRDLFNAIEQATTANEQLKKPDVTDEQRKEAARQKAAAVRDVETIAQQENGDAETQLEAGKGLAKVDEAPRAIPYAERGLKLAEASGDPKMIRAALLAGGEVYYKAGKYELSRERLERVLKSNPKDPDALAMYMQVKDRSSSGSAPRAGGSPAPPSRPAAGQGPTPGDVERMGDLIAKAAPLSNAANLDAQRKLALGWGALALDPGAAIKHFDAAVAADPKNASVRVERAKARLRIAEFRGALEDANFALSLAPGLGAAHAARAEAFRGLGRTEAEVLAEYEAAAKLDGSFTEAYQALLAASRRPAAGTGSRSAGAESGGESAPDEARRLGPLPPASKGFLVLIGLIAGVVVGAGGLFLLLRRRSREADSLRR